MDEHRAARGRGGPGGGIARRGQLDAAAHAYLAGQDHLRVLKLDEDSFEAIVEQQVRQRAHEIREDQQRELALRIAHVLAGRSPDGK